MTDKDTRHMYSYMTDIFQEPWFFADITKAHSESHCKSHIRDGLFLVRLNMGGSRKIEDYPFTITCVIGEKMYVLASILMKVGF